MKFAIPFVALLVGLAIGVAAVSNRTPAGPTGPALPTPTEQTDQLATARTAWDAERGQLQARIQELDQAVVDRDRIITKLRSDIREAPVATKEATLADKDGDRRRDGAKDGQGGDRPRSLADLKERDPEAYERIRERIAGFTTRMQAATLSQAQFMETLDQALMTEEQRDNHLKLQETLLAIQTTMEKLNNNELDNADSWQMRREMMGTLRDIGPMLQTQRTVALSQIGHDLGYESPEERQEFVEYMDNVYNMTSAGTLWRGMMGDRNRGRNNDDKKDQE